MQVTFILATPMMNAMHVEIVRGAADLLRQRHEELLRDRTLAQPVRSMIDAHMTKPWIADFWSVAIRSPLGDGDQSYFDFPIVRVHGVPWFFPSRQWWVAHAHASHPPDGSGCDVDVHTNFLSREGSMHEFDYATILLDGWMTILGRRDFVDECLWWRRALS
jgi:hypothetical protein